MPFRRYMEMALYEPGLGYYVNGLHKFGSAGDFITAPEQGELFGRAIARQLDTIAAALPDSDWTLLELGPGSGALARVLMTRLEHPPARMLLLERSAALRQVQVETLADLPQALRTRVDWVDGPPDAFHGAIVANEVIDALPVERLRIQEHGDDRRIASQYLTLDGDAPRWTAGPADARLRHAVARIERDLGAPLGAGYRSEVCTDLGGWLETVTDPLTAGAVLLADYGYPRREFYHPDRSSGTLVCHYRHRAHFDPLIWPGLTDLSAFVDFTAVADGLVAAGLDLDGFTSQAGFLLGSGIQDVIEREQDVALRLRLAGELKRLVLPGEMGETFKVMLASRGIDVDGTAFGLSDQIGRL